MNKTINLFSLILFAVLCFLTIGSIYDLGFSVYEVNDIPYIKEIVYGISMLIFLLGLIRIRRRLEGRKDINTYQNFQFSSPISKTAINNATLFISIEVLFGAGLAILLLKIQEWDDQMLVLPILIIIGVLILESIVYLKYLRQNQDKFRIGIGPHFLAYFDREMKIYYYKGLTRVEVYQNMINFRFKKDLNLFLSLDIIPSDQQKAFFEALENALAEKTVFFDDSFHQYVTSL